MFSEVDQNQPVCLSVFLCVHVSICVQNTSFCEGAGGGIKSRLAAALAVLGYKDFIENYKESNLRCLVYSYLKIPYTMIFSS